MDGSRTEIQRRETLTCPVSKQGVENGSPFSHSRNVNKYRLVSFFLVGLAIFSGCEKREAASAPPHSIEDRLPKQAQPKQPTIKLWIGSEELTAEMALSAIQQQTGMMFRTNTVENEGMIFVLPQAMRASFWMKNCFVPLSIAYIDPDGVIQEIHDLQPQNTNSVWSTSRNIRFALETSQGWFQRHNISTGTLVRTERGSLMDTFVRRRQGQ